MKKEAHPSIVHSEISAVCEYLCFDQRRPTLDLLPLYRCALSWHCAGSYIRSHLSQQQQK